MWHKHLWDISENEHLLVFSFPILLLRLEALALNKGPVSPLDIQYFHGNLLAVVCGHAQKYAYIYLSTNWAND